MRTEPAENLDLLNLAFHVGVLAAECDSVEDSDALLDALQTRDWVKLAYTIGNNAHHDEECADNIKELLINDD